MKIQLKILLKILKNNWKWIAILLFIVILKLTMIMLQPTDAEITYYDFLNLICYPNLKDTVNILLSLYQIGLYLYLILVFYTYEIEYSFENIILRSNEKKWINFKIITSIVFVIITKTIYILLIYLLFKIYFPLKIYYLIYPNVFHIISVLSLITFVNIFKNNNKFILILSLIISYLVYKYFYLNISLILIVFIIVMNIWLFRFKRITV